MADAVQGARAPFVVRYERHQGIIFAKGVDTLEGVHTELRSKPGLRQRLAGVNA